MSVSIIMKSSPWAMSFGINALLLHFDLETVRIYAPGDGYDTANVDRRHFGAALVEERFRLWFGCTGMWPLASGAAFFLVDFNSLLPHPGGITRR
ncbi:MAG: hypothetical protein VB125_00925 [Burkholderia sp.]